MSLPPEPADYPAAVRFSFHKENDAVEVSCELISTGDQQPYDVSGTTRVASLDEFKAKAMEAGMSPATAEDPDRSFNATARQLRELGFTVKVRREGIPA